MSKYFILYSDIFSQMVCVTSIDYPTFRHFILLIKTCLRNASSPLVLAEWKAIGVLARNSVSHRVMEMLRFSVLSVRIIDVLYT